MINAISGNGEFLLKFFVEFVEQIHQWFKEETAKDSRKLGSFCRAFQKNDVSAIEDGFNTYLKKTISIRDTNAGVR